MLRPTLRDVLAVLALTLSAGASSAAPAQPVAKVAQGKVSGLRADGVDRYLGLPYAAPPVGGLRWRPPAPPAGWPGIRPAKSFGASCMQKTTPDGFGPWTHEYVVAGPVSEDCLTLNIWTPAAGHKGAPVMVWIHGGGFTGGGAAVPVYDGAALARQGVVVVSLNYRLGAFGFLPSAEFRQSGGNFGLQDQIAALRWVKANIAAFGGDPRRVTIAGQSAGGASVNQLLVSPMARDLFAQAIPQSSVGLGLGKGTATSLSPRDEAEATGAAFLAKLGAASFEEARALPAETILAAAGPGVFRFAPYSDGVVTPSDPQAAINALAQDRRPVMTGVTADEASGLNPLWGIVQPDNFDKILKHRYGPLAPEFARLYPASPTAFPALLRDVSVAAVDFWIKARVQAGGASTYGYVFTHVQPGPAATRYGAFHTSEVPYIFGALGKAPERNFTEVDTRVSELMGRYWVNFLRSGDPNGAGLPTWPKGELGLMELSATPAPYPLPSAEKRDLFRKHLAAGGTLGVH